MEVFSRFRRAMRIRLKIMVLTLGTVFISVFLLSTLVTTQYQALLLKKTEDVCGTLSQSLSGFAREELLTHHTVGTYEGTRNAVAQLKGAHITGLLSSYVIYSEGQVVAHTSEEKVGETAPAADLADFRRFTKLEKQERAGTQGGVIRFVDPIFVDLPGKLRPLVGWVVFEFDRKEIYSPIDAVRRNIEYLSVILLLASAVVAAVLSRRLSRPIEDLARVAEDLGRGNLGVKVQINTGGEIGELANVFNEMSRSLKDAEGRKIQQATAARELEMARGIQTAVLPADGDRGPYSFLGYMETATEVGGDYYDLIEISKGGKRYWWFLIGDVCGHGLQAGITMLMAQTAFHTAMEIKPNLEPDEAFIFVNSVLLANVQRLKENRYMTATFFRADQSGRFVMAGLHQDILIYRKKKKSVEIIESRGAWLALEPDIRKETKNGKFRLDPGDFLFLFTDGITEAMDHDSALFGQEKLVEVLQKAGHSGLDAVRSQVIEAIRVHQKGRRPVDDITFAMIRRNK